MTDVGAARHKQAGPFNRLKDMTGDTHIGYLEIMLPYVSDVLLGLGR